MKRRRRGPRGFAFFDLADGDLRHSQSQRATCTAGSRAMTIEESGSICVTENPSPLGGTPSHTAAAEVYHDVVMSSGSEPDGCPSDDTDISSEEERPPVQFASRR